MRIIKKILLVLAIIFVAIAAIGFIFFPSHIHVERSSVINKTPDVVFNYAGNMDNYNQWSPWYFRDTAASYIFEGPKSGVGASLKWDSQNKEVGKGSMTFTEVKPDSVIRIDLNFMENGVAKGTYAFSPEGGGTKMTWSLDVEAGANPIFRIMGSFMDGMIGKDFESGLAKLKTNIESMPEVPAPAVPDSVVVQ